MAKKKNLTDGTASTVAPSTTPLQLHLQATLLRSMTAELDLNLCCTLAYKSASNVSKKLEMKPLNYQPLPD